jgi:hypothetical protein
VGENERKDGKKEIFVESAWKVIAWGSRKAEQNSMSDGKFVPALALALISSASFLSGRNWWFRAAAVLPSST